MSEKIYNQLILIIDQTTNGIVCTAFSDPHAASIVLGMPNGRAMAYEKYFDPKNKKYYYDYNTLSKHYQLVSNFDVVSLPEKFITLEWISFRKLVQQKQIYLAFWEFKIRQYMNSVNDFYGLPNMMSFLTEQLSLCNPNESFYTRAIVEWADIQEATPQAAYQELKIRQEGYGLVYMRSHALYLKHAKKITMAKTFDQIEQEFYNGCFNLLEKTKI
jgi:hypothetical protein